MYNLYQFQIAYMPEAHQNNFQIRQQSGVIYAKNYSDCMKELMLYFGNDETASVQVSLVEDETPVLILNESIVANIKEGKYFNEYDN